MPPEALIRKMKAGYRGSGLSEKEINHRVYGHLNKTGQLAEADRGDRTHGGIADAMWAKKHLLPKFIEEADSHKSKLVKKIRRKQRVEKYLRRSY